MISQIMNEFPRFDHCKFSTGFDDELRECVGGPFVGYPHARIIFIAVTEVPIIGKTMPRPGKNTGLGITLPPPRVERRGN